MKDLDALYASFDGTQAMFRHVEKRLTSLELSVSAMETERAVSEEKQKFMDVRFTHIDRRLEKIEGHISRLVWVVIAGILGGLMSLVLQGSDSVKDPSRVVPVMNEARLEAQVMEWADVN
ncbi:MAG: hypothetical protein AAGF53_00360 [Pseudomonadota bacterium]